MSEIKLQIWKTPFETPHEQIRTTRLWLKGADVFMQDGIVSGDIFFSFDSENLNIPRYSPERFEQRLKTVLGPTADIALYHYDNRGCDDGVARGNIRFTFDSNKPELEKMTFEEIRHALLALLDSIDMTKFEDLPDYRNLIKCL